MKYAFIKGHRTHYGLSLLCRTMEVSVSGYYDWLGRPPSKTQTTNQRLLTKIRCFHKASRQRYGSPRIHQDLVYSGEKVSRPRVARLMKTAGIQSKMAKRFVITTNSKNSKAPAPNRLKREFRVREKNKAWVADTTFIRTRQGWLYLATMMDLYSRQIIGWAMSERNDTKLVTDALIMSVSRRGKVDNVIVHSDQGSTYASSDYRKLIKDEGLVCSMSRKGECHDNAVAVGVNILFA